MPTLNVNKCVMRDPISGRGIISVCNADGEQKPRTKSQNRKDKNPILLAWENGATENEEVNKRNVAYSVRDPIALIGDLGEEVDILRTTVRPRTGIPREPQRNPISGQGNFGTKEWDPIWKYNGRTRRSKSSNGIRSNPITGINLKTFEINMEIQPKVTQIGKNKTDNKRNILTGENCDTYTMTPESNKPSKKSAKVLNRNAITGENCISYDINTEQRQSKKPNNAPIPNPLRGENVSSYVITKDEKPRSNRPHVYKNTITGENLESYQITPIERKIKASVTRERQDPVCGENVKTYTYRIGEGKLATTKRDIGSPLTGKGSRDESYNFCVGEKPNTGARQRARSMGAVRNILTGENCESYMVYREMRSERVKCAENGYPYPKSNYNILTGM